MSKSQSRKAFKEAPVLPPAMPSKRRFMGSPEYAVMMAYEAWQGREKNRQAFPPGTVVRLQTRKRMFRSLQEALVGTLRLRGRFGVVQHEVDEDFYRERARQNREERDVMLYVTGLDPKNRRIGMYIPAYHLQVATRKELDRQRGREQRAPHNNMDEATRTAT